MSGHDTAILPAFAGEAGQIGGGRPIVPLDSPAFFLRFNAKSGIVAGLDAPVGFAFEIVEILALKRWS